MTPDSVRKAVWEKKPALKALVAEHGGKSIAEYIRTSAPKPRALEEKRKQELSATFFDIVQPMLGNEVATKATEHLLKTLFVSTADHHGPICHPFFMNVNVVQGIVNQEENPSDPAPIIVLSCGGISLNNSSFPRGLLVHDKHSEQHVPLVSLRYRHVPVYALGSYMSSNIKILEKKMKQVVRGASIAVQEKAKAIIDIYKRDDVLSRTRYSKQVTITNHRFWKLLPGQENIDLIYVEQEDVVIKLLLRYHMQAKTMPHRILFDKEVTQLFKENFDGIMGAFHEKNQHGTFLFWGIQDGARIRFQYDQVQHALVSDDSRITIPLNPATIQTALEKHELMPSMALTFIVLMFYYGITCSGGFSQINYLPAMQKAYVTMLRAMDENEEMKHVDLLQGNIFRGEFVLATLARQKDTNGKHPVHATSIDYYIYSDETTPDRMRRLAATTSLSDAIDAMMPALYKIVTGEKTAHAGYATIDPILFINE